MDNSWNKWEKDNGRRHHDGPTWHESKPSTHVGPWITLDQESTFFFLQYKSLDLWAMNEGIRGMELNLNLIAGPIKDVSFQPYGPMISGALGGVYHAISYPVGAVLLF